MWENAQLTNAEYRARRHWLIEHLAEDPKHLNELGDLDGAFRKLSEAKAARVNAIRLRCGFPPASSGSAAGRIRTAIHRGFRPQQSRTFDFS
jgi:hypothetical protein